jgi:phosphoribosyl 1,2-cyclic phosphodiesterase/DNA-binding response OmpR family regulator
VRIQFWGTRGSIAKPGPATARYGGNTSCVEVRADSGTLIVVDCGTGAHDLGRQLVAQAGGAVDGHILISHTHWDHIQGIPFFEPLFTAGSAWDIYGPKGLSQSLRTTLAGQMEHTYFPITLDQFAATIRYHDLVEGAFALGDVQVITRYLNHPALTLGYRFEADGASLAYCCDHEPHSAALASGDAAITGMDERYADFVAGADLVIHDAQYTALEYPSKVGWGHSPAEYAVRICRDAGVKRLVLTHHDPLRDDDAVDRIIEAIRLRLRRDGASLEVLAAAEGLVIQLRDPGRSSARSQGHFRAETAIDVSSATRPVLLCLADARMTAVLSEAVTSEGLPLRVLADGEALLRAVAGDRPSLVMVEHDPPRIDAHEIAGAIRRGEAAGDVQVPVVIVTAGDRVAVPGNGIATDWLAAPFSLSYARTKIRAWALRTACRWMRAQVPADEERRLKALRELAILDTAPEERIDRLTRIAAAALDVPIALVSLVDRDRQWFKSCFGLNASETPRDAAFCAHAVLQKDEVVVPDALLDERFADNPLVLGEPRVRFYAGAPLILDDGSCIGTFCVIDTRPRELGEADMATLRDLRDLALEEIKRRRS